MSTCHSGLVTPGASFQETITPCWRQFRDIRATWRRCGAGLWERDGTGRARFEPQLFDTHPARTAYHFGRRSRCPRKLNKNKKIKKNKQKKKKKKKKKKTKKKKTKWMGSASNTDNYPTKQQRPCWRAVGTTRWFGAVLAHARKRLSADATANFAAHEHRAEKSETPSDLVRWRGPVSRPK